MAKAPLLAFELYELCALEARGVPGGYFDGPHAWSIVTLRIEGEAERTESDKQFYLTALEMQKGNPLPDGCSAADFQKMAFAFVQYICPTWRRNTNRRTRLSTS